MDKFDDQINMFEKTDEPKRTKKRSLDAKAKKIIDMPHGEIYEKQWKK